MTNLAFNQSGSGLQHLKDQATVNQCTVMGKPIEANIINVVEKIAQEHGNGRIDTTDLLVAANREAVTVVQSPEFVTPRADATQEYKYDVVKNEGIGQQSLTLG